MNKGDIVLWLLAVSCGSISEAQGTEMHGSKRQPPAVARLNSTANGWYGWQTLLADGASALIVGAGASTESVPLVALGSGGYLLGAPIVHSLHGSALTRPRLSVGMRVALPVVGATLAGVAASCKQRTDDPALTLCPLGEAALGSLIGAGIAVILDATVLAYDTGGPGPVRGYWLTPNLVLGRDSGSLVLSGTF